MNIWVVILISLSYIIVGGIIAVLAGRLRWGEDNDFFGGSLDERVEITQVLLFLFWPIPIVLLVISFPFYGVYKLINIVFNKLWRE